MSKPRPIHAFVLIAVLGGCDTCDPKPEPPKTCTPACGTGYTCDNGTCVGSCKAAECASGACATPSQCAQCTNDTHCGGSTPRCNTATKTCVACLTSGDNCSFGNHCDGATNTCTKGCKANNECASNSCGASHDCNSCVNDGECSLGKICNAGVCESPCSGSCAGGKLCCGSACVNQFQDTGCHACNVTCTASQFCGATACVATKLDQICALDAALIAHDGDFVDNEANDQVAAQLSDACGRTITTTVAETTSATFMNQTTGQPLAAPGKLIFVAGGSFANPMTKYLVEEPGLTKVFDGMANDGVSYAFRRRSDNAELLVVDPNTLNNAHDFFLIQIVKEPTTKAVSIVFYGLDVKGTYAAAWYIINRVIPMRASFTGSYYIVEWTDNDGDESPGEADIYGIHLHD